VLRRPRWLRPRRALSTASSIERPNSPLTRRPLTPRAEDVPFVVELRDGGPGVMVTR
jgi:hypothetical protein